MQQLQTSGEAWKVLAPSLSQEELNALGFSLLNAYLVRNGKAPLDPKTEVTAVVGKDGSLTVTVTKRSTEIVHQFEPSHVESYLLSFHPQGTPPTVENLKEVVKDLAEERYSGGWGLSWGAGTGISLEGISSKDVPTFVNPSFHAGGQITHLHRRREIGGEVTWTGGRRFEGSLLYSSGFNLNVPGGIDFFRGPALTLGVNFHNPYLKLNRLFEGWVWRKLSVRGVGHLSLGPVSLSFQGWRVYASLSFATFAFNYLYWSIFPTALQYAGRFAKEGEGFSAFAKGVVGFVAGTFVGLWQALGFERGYREARRAKGLGKVWAFLRGTTLGFVDNLRRYTAQQINDIVRFGVETFYLLHHLLGIGARAPSKPLTEAEYHRRLEEIRREMERGYYFKALKDLEALKKAVASTEGLAYVEGEIQALHEAAEEYALHHHGLFSFVNHLSLGWFASRLTAEKRRSEERVKNVLEKARSGELTEEDRDEVEWALGYLTAKFNNPAALYTLGGRLPSSFAPLAFFVDLPPPEAVYAIYLLTKKAVGGLVKPEGENVYFYHTLLNNLQGMECCVPPNYMPYVNAALSLLRKKRPEVARASEEALKSWLESPTPSFFASAPKEQLLLQLMGVVGERLHRGEGDISWLRSYAVKHIDVVEKAYDNLYLLYQEAWKALEKGDIATFHRVMQSIYYAHRAFVELYTSLEGEDRDRLFANITPKMVEVNTAFRYYAPLFMGYTPPYVSALILSKGIYKDQKKLEELEKGIMRVVALSLLSLPEEEARHTLGELSANLEKKAAFEWPALKELLEKLRQTPYSDWPLVVNRYI